MLFVSDCSRLLTVKQIVVARAQTVSHEPACSRHFSIRRPMSRNQTARATVPLHEPISLVSSSDNDEDLVFVKTHNPSEQPTAAAAGPTRAELAKDEPLFSVDWEERGDATTALKTHSTAQGARIQQTKKSGGQCFTFMCDSVLAKGMPKEENAGDVRCKFLAQVNKLDGQRRGGFAAVPSLNSWDRSQSASASANHAEASATSKRTAHTRPIRPVQCHPAQGARVVVTPSVTGNHNLLDRQ